MIVWPKPETRLDIARRKLRDYRGGAVLSDAEADALTSRLAKADKLAEALRAFVEPDPHTDGYGEIERGAAALVEWAAESIRSTPDETPANQGVEAPSGFEPLFQSAEPKADE